MVVLQGQHAAAVQHWLPAHPPLAGLNIYSYGVVVIMSVHSTDIKSLCSSSRIMLDKENAQSP
jgi:hypothetical protein